MKTEQEIKERAEMFRRFADKLCTPVDPLSIGSVSEAMARKIAFTTAAEELEWVLK